MKHYDPKQLREIQYKTYTVRVRKSIKKLSLFEAINYLDDIAHGGKMVYDPYELYVYIRSEVAKLLIKIHSLEKENEKI